MGCSNRSVPVSRNTYPLPLTFAHIDADAFFASVLERKDPRLKGKPLFALGAGGGVVIAASYAAKAKGVKTGMRLAEAKKLCPEAIARLSDFTEACAASKQIESILRMRLEGVEQMSVDEWFLDLKTLPGGIPMELEAWARALQADITRSVGISMSVGIAPTKLLAKMASEYQKPAGVTVVLLPPTPYALPPHPACLSLESFLKNRPEAAIPGIGPARQVHAASLNWQTAWDFANAEQKTVVHLFGRPGRDLQEELKGIPVTSVVTHGAPPKSVSRGRSFRMTNDRNRVLSLLVEHVSICVLRMRGEGLACRRIALWLRDATFRYVGDQIRLPRAMNTEDALLPYARHCLERLWRSLRGCTQAGIALHDLIPAGPAQYSLFTEPQNIDRAEQVQETLDAIRTRFGRSSIVRATGLEKASTRPRLPTDLSSVASAKEEASAKAGLPNAYGQIGTTQ